MAQTPSKINQPYFLDMVNCEKLVFQTVPTDLNYDSGPTWNVVATPGRNNPLYQYTGAEDTLVFTLTWYADEIGKKDVLTKIKWIESISKNNGYDEKPHRIKFMFGKLFNDTEWIIFSSPAKFSLFDRQTDMLPCLAVQEITLKRVMTINRTTSSIRKLDT